MKLSNLFKNTLASLFTISLTMFYNDSCSDVICLFPGRGLPLGFYYNKLVDIKFLILDFLFWFLIWLLIFKLIKRFK